MTTIWTEDQITLNNLAQHFEDCGKRNVSVCDERINVYTDTWLAMAVHIDEGRKFLGIGSYLPIDKSRPRIELLEFIQRLNNELFLASFSIDQDGDISIGVAVCYEHGLIIAQFMIVLNRFGSMIGHIIDKLNEDGLIVFDSDGDDDKAGNSDDSSTTHGSRPKGVLLN